MTRAAGGPAQWLDLDHQPTATEEAIARGFEGTTLSTDRVVQPSQRFAAVVAVLRWRNGPIGVPGRVRTHNPWTPGHR